MEMENRIRQIYHSTDYLVPIRELYIRVSEHSERDWWRFQWRRAWRDHKWRIYLRRRNESIDYLNFFRSTLTDRGQLILTNFVRLWHSLYNKNIIIDLLETFIITFKRWLAQRNYSWSHWLSSITRAIKYQILIFQADDINI